MVRKVGTGGKNKLNGTSGSDQLFGLGGNDTIKGKAGNDLLDGGSGNDIIRGGDGKDKIFGGSGNDTINGDAGNDIINGGKGQDFILGGAGNDTLTDTAYKFQFLSGGDGNDRIIMSGDTGAFTQTFSYLFGNAGKDVILDGASNSFIDGGSEDDYIFGDYGFDVMVGGTGADQFVFTDGDGFQNNIAPGVNAFDDIVRDFETGIDKIVLIGVAILSHENWDDTANGNGTGLRVIYNDGSGVAGTFFIRNYTDAQYVLNSATDFILV